MYLWQEDQSETIGVEDDEEEVACKQHIGFDEQDPNEPEPDVKEEPRSFCGFLPRMTLLMCKSH